MNYGYKIWNKVVINILKDFPPSSIRNFKDYNDIKKAFQNGTLPKDKVIPFLGFTAGDRVLQTQLHQAGYKLFPKYEFSKFIEHRDFYLPYLDRYFPTGLKRVFVEGGLTAIRDVVASHFRGAQVVLKFGDLHASEGKYLVKDLSDFPRIHPKHLKMPCLVEEFVPNARSIRVGYVGNPNNLDNYFISEFINPNTWLKNNNPQEEIVYSYAEAKEKAFTDLDAFINTTRSIGLHLNADIMGVDYVKRGDLVYILELNDMIGLPDGEFALELFSRGLKGVLNGRV